jgi:hypothetical protein
MKKNEERSMRVESERIRDVKRQDICEMVRNNREYVPLLIAEDFDWTCEQCNTSITLVWNYDRFWVSCRWLYSRCMKWWYGCVKLAESRFESAIQRSDGRFTSRLIIAVTFSLLRRL